MRVADFDTRVNRPANNDRPILGQKDDLFPSRVKKHPDSSPLLDSRNSGCSDLERCCTLLSSFGPGLEDACGLISDGELNQAEVEFRRPQMALVIFDRVHP